MVISEKQKNTWNNIIGDITDFLYYRYKAAMQQPVVMKKKKSNSGAPIIGALAGFVIGLGGAMLFATHTGKETRAWLSDQMSTTSRRAGEQFNKGTKSVRQAISKAKKSRV